MHWLGSEPRTPAEALLCRVLDSASAAGTRVCLYGGYAMDAFAGRPLRRHQDVDFFARLPEWPALLAALDGGEYALEYASTGTAVHVRRGDATLADVLLFEEHPEGFPFIRAPLGANPLPPGSFTDGPEAVLWGRPARIVTPECVYVMKSSGNFTADAGAPLRAKDRQDLALLRTLIPEAGQRELRRYYRIRPL